MTKRTEKIEAFTLLEIIIALSMLVLILGSVYGTYIAATRSLAHSKPRHALQQQASIFLQRIASEIRCCYAGYRDKSQHTSKNTFDRVKKNHLHQENESLFKGEEASSGQSFLRFVTSKVTSKRDHWLGGLAIIEYLFDSSTNTLSRRKRRFIDGFKVDRYKDIWIVVLENVQSINVEYFDGEVWRKEWNSNDLEGLLPKAVGISIVLQSEDVGPMTFEVKVQTVCKPNQSIGLTVQQSTESGEILQSINDNQNSDE